MKDIHGDSIVVTPAYRAGKVHVVIRYQNGESCRYVMLTPEKCLKLAAQLSKAALEAKQ